MALNFPASPANGDTHDDTSNGIRYIYNSTKNQWTALAEFTTGAIGAQRLDDLQSSFQGTNKVFTLKVDGSTVKPHDSRSITIYLNNVIQRAETDYTVNSGTGQITFTSAPAATDTFYGIVLARLPLAVDQLPLTGGTMTGDINFSTTQVIPHDQIQSATTNRFGVTKLSDATDSTSTTLAATSKAVKDAKDAADAAASTANSASSAASSASTTANNALPKAGGTMTGDITFNSTQEFDGRDLSVDGTKLDGIATSANNYSISSDLLDEDDMASDSETKVASQQSIKAYVDAHTGATDLSYTASSRELASSTGTNVNLPEATTSAAGLQSSADKTKLDGIETNATADQTGAEIKSAYEGEADTNAFTDADHTKLDGIATGAEVNVNADWNSTSGDSEILNKPTLVSALNDLSDVSAASPSANQIIKWNGSEWALAADGGGGGGGVSQNLIVTLTESIDGSRTDFTMNTTPATAQNLMVSINGVIQKPNAGTTISNSSEGYCVSGSTLKFATAPANGSTVFVVAQTAGSGGSTDLSFDDDAKIKLGTGNDFEIYHNGSDNIIKAVNSNTTYIDGQAAWVYIQSNAGIQLGDVGSNEIFLKATDNGSVELYYDNSGPKLATTATGVNLGGGTCTFNDNGKLALGTGSDLEIYHDGTHSYIENATGGFYIKVGNGEFLNRGGTEVLAKFIENGAVELYYDNSKKFDTHSGGVSVFGNLSLTNADSYQLRLGAGSDFRFYHDGNNSVINNDTGGLYIKNDGVIEFQKASSGETKAKFISDGNVELYYDNAKKAETTAHGLFVTGSLWADGIYLDDNEKIHLGTSGTDFEILHDGTNSYVSHNDGSGNLLLQGDAIRLRTRYATGNEDYITCSESGAVKLYYNNAVKFETTSTGCKFTGAYFESSGINQEIRLGSGATSLRVWSNGTNAHIRNNIGTLSRIYINNTASTSSYLGVDPIDQTTTALVIRKAVNSEFYPCWFANTNGNQGEIKVNAGGGTSYETSSDYRLKENISTITDGITRVKQLIPRRFNWKNDDTKKLWDGFIAHEVSPAVPSAVTGEKDAPIDADGNGYQGMEKGQLIPVLTAALKEAITKIETLETKVAALEGA